MTQEEHNLLVENNIMLKQIISYLTARDNVPLDVKDFTMNVIANLISNNTDNFK